MSSQYEKPADIVIILSFQWSIGTYTFLKRFLKTIVRNFSRIRYIPALIKQAY